MRTELFSFCTRPRPADTILEIPCCAWNDCRSNRSRLAVSGHRSRVPNCHRFRQLNVKASRMSRLGLWPHGQVVCVQTLTRNQGVGRESHRARRACQPPAREHSGVFAERVVRPGQHHRKQVIVVPEFPQLTEPTRSAGFGDIAEVDMNPCTWTIHAGSIGPGVPLSQHIHPHHPRNQRQGNDPQHDVCDPLSPCFRPAQFEHSEMVPVRTGPSTPTPQVPKPGENIALPAPHP